MFNFEFSPWNPLNKITICPPPSLHGFHTNKAWEAGWWWGHFPLGTPECGQITGILFSQGSKLLWAPVKGVGELWSVTWDMRMVSLEQRPRWLESTVNLCKPSEWATLTFRLFQPLDKACQIPFGSLKGAVIEQGPGGGMFSCCPETMACRGGGSRADRAHTEAARTTPSADNEVAVDS